MADVRLKNVGCDGKDEKEEECIQKSKRSVGETQFMTTMSVKWLLLRCRVFLVYKRITHVRSSQFRPSGDGIREN